MSPVHIGEMRSEMDVQPDATGGGGGAGAGGAGGGGDANGWAARMKHAKLREAIERARARTDGRGFDA